MGRPVYTVDNPITVLQKVEQLQKELRGYDYRLVTTETVESAEDLADLFDGCFVPKQATKITLRFKEAGEYTEAVFVKTYSNESQASFTGFLAGYKLTIITVTFDGEKGYVSDIANP